MRLTKLTKPRYALHGTSLARLVRRLLGLELHLLGLSALHRLAEDIVSNKEVSMALDIVCQILQKNKDDILVLQFCRVAGVDGSSGGLSATGRATFLYNLLPEAEII